MIQSGIERGIGREWEKETDVILYRKNKALPIPIVPTLPLCQLEYFQLQIMENGIGPNQPGLSNNGDLSVHIIQMSRGRARCRVG